MWLDAPAERSLMLRGLVVHVMHKGDEWRLPVWRQLIASARSRTLRSGLIQIVAEILARLTTQGVLSRADALEYLANSREPWTIDSTADAEGNEPLSQLVEKLDATVFGLIEALDANIADLPRLLDEALQGSLWARQIAREHADVQAWHKAILEFPCKAHLAGDNSNCAKMSLCDGRWSGGRTFA